MAAQNVFSTRGGKRKRMPETDIELQKLEVLNRMAAKVDVQPTPDALNAFGNGLWSMTLRRLKGTDPCLHMHNLSFQLRHWHSLYARSWSRSTLQDHGHYERLWIVYIVTVFLFRYFWEFIVHFLHCCTCKHIWIYSTSQKFWHTFPLSWMCKYVQIFDWYCK